MKRSKVIEAVKELPEDVELEALFERLIFIEKVEQALVEADAGKVVAHSKVRKLVSKW